MNAIFSSTTERKIPAKEQLYLGIKAGIPICIGYLPIAMAFGLLAKEAGLSLSQGTLMSLLVYAGASQFVAVNMLTLNMNWLQIILTVFILNFRHFLMSASLSQKLSNVKTYWLPLIAFGVTDESFAVAGTQKENNLSPFYLIGLMFSAYLAWFSGTVLGFVIAGSLPKVLQSGMGIALYAMFIGLLIPPVKKCKSFGFVALLGASFNIFLYQLLTPGWALVFSAVLGALVATFLMKEV